MLIIVPTPIGNLEDITLRALRALREADVVACEDTRRTLKLLNHYEIKKPLLSYHEHNELARTGELLSRVASGERVALVSDAGTPGISDPGYIVVAEAMKRGLPVDVLPGANALLPALLLSGLPPSPFFFVGFVEGSEKEKNERLSEIAGVRATLLFYLPPHGAAKSLTRFRDILGERRASVVREISKVHQETICGTLATLVNELASRDKLGEMALVVEGCKDEAPTIDDDVWMEEALRLRAEGAYTKDIASAMSDKYKIPRNKIKNFLSSHC